MLPNVFMMAQNTCIQNYKAKSYCQQLNISSKYYDGFARLLFIFSFPLSYDAIINLCSLACSIKSVIYMFFFLKMQDIYWFDFFPEPCVM